MPKLPGCIDSTECRQCLTVSDALIEPFPVGVPCLLVEEECSDWEGIALAERYSVTARINCSVTRLPELHPGVPQRDAGNELEWVLGWALAFVTVLLLGVVLWRVWSSLKLRRQLRVARRPRRSPTPSTSTDDSTSYKRGVRDWMASCACGGSKDSASVSGANIPTIDRVSSEEEGGPPGPRGPLNKAGLLNKATGGRGKKDGNRRAKHAGPVVPVPSQAGPSSRVAPPAATQPVTPGKKSPKAATKADILMLAEASATYNKGEGNVLFTHLDFDAPAGGRSGDGE